MLYWRIWYADETTFSNEDGEWIDAPDRGVICVVVLDPSGAWGRRVRSGATSAKCEACGRGVHPEYYVNLPDGLEPRETHELDSFRFQANREGVSADIVESCIKYGEQVDTLVWQHIMNLAVTDPGFPKGTPQRRSGDKE